MNDLPLSRRGVMITLVIACIAAVAAITLAYTTNTRDDDESRASEPGAPTTDPLDVDAALDWLPYPPEDLIQAGQIATDYAELYTSLSDAESIDAYYDALHSYTTREYAERLQPGAGVVSARQGLLDEGVTISATATVDHVRVLMEDQVTIVVDCTTVTNSPDGQQNDDYEFAVTLVPVGEGDWEVHGLDLAEVGQSGDTPEGMPGA